MKYISYEYDYDKYEIIEEKRRLLVHVFHCKNGASCPDCGQYSNHIYMEEYVIA